MKTILVPVEDHACLPSVLAVALLLGRQFRSYIEGFALGPDFRQLLAGADMAFAAPPIPDEETRRDMIARARRRYEGFMREHDVPERLEEPHDLCFGWLDGDLHIDPLVGDYGRVFDVIVLGRPSGDDRSPRLSTLEEALFDSGRPVLVAPPEPPTEMGRVVVIAWNGSIETARAAASAMPLLRGARRVVVLTVLGGTAPGPTGEQLARTLRINGVPAEAMDVRDDDRSTGEAIAANARRLGADLLVKGAYTQSRLRQMIFGGATRHLIENATIPMLMAH